jgi:hypothetical protein
LARVSPDTTSDVWIPFNHFGEFFHLFVRFYSPLGGYYYNDGWIRAISHTHMVGSGVVDYGTIGVMPYNKIPTFQDVYAEGYASAFYHSTETVRPGYYKV